MKKIIFCLVFVFMLLNIFSCSSRTSVESIEEKNKNVWEKMFKDVKKETEVQANHPLVLLKEIKSQNLFSDDDKGDLDKIIRFRLEWCLKGISDQKDFNLTQRHCEDSLRFLRNRKVRYHPEVEKVLKKYWDTKKRIESAQEQKIEPLEKDKFESAKKMEEIYFMAGAISISNGNLEETLRNLEKATEHVRIAEIVGDFDRLQTWAKPWPK